MYHCGQKSGRDGWSDRDIGLEVMDGDLGGRPGDDEEDEGEEGVGDEEGGEEEADGLFAADPVADGFFPEEALEEASLVEPVPNRQHVLS